MYFCDNRKCENHVDVSEKVYLSGAIMINRSSHHGEFTVIEIKRHDYMKNECRISLCDICTNAIKMCI